MVSNKELHGLIAKASAKGAKIQPITCGDAYRAKGELPLILGIYFYGVEFRGALTAAERIREYLAAVK